MSERAPRQSSGEQLRRRNRELSILNAIADALNRQIDLDQALHTVLAQAAQLLDLHTGWIWLLHETTGESYLAAAHHLPPALAHQPAKMEGSCYCLDTYRQGDLNGAANVNVITCTRLKGLVDGTGGLRYHASIPLYAYEKKLGVMNLASSDWRELSADDLRILHTVGDLLSIAIERARLFATSVQLGAAEERNRLAREIHDTLAQGMTAVALQLETADAQLDAGMPTERVQQTVRQALRLTRENLEEARRSVLDLRAAPLEGRTLPQALASLAKEWSAASGTAITFKATGGSHPLPSRAEVGVYRMVQEALTNSVRHAGARRIHVTLVLTPHELRCTVADDGKGFDTEQVSGGHFGLVGLNERAKLLGGSMKLESAPGEGTCIAITVPLEAR